MRKALLALSLFAILISSLQGQVRRDSASRIRFGSALPATCNAGIGQVFFIVSPGTPVGLHQCLATDTWTAVGTGTVTGTGAATQVAVFDGASSIAGGADLTFSSDILAVGDGSANAEIRALSASSGIAGVDWVSGTEVHVGTASGTTVDVSFIRGGTVIFEINNDSITMGLPAASKDIRWIHDTAPIDALILDGADLVATGQTDSHSVLWTGRSFDGGAHDADWKAFVDVTSDVGASTWTLQSRIDAAAYADRITIDDAGSVVTTGSGPHAFGTGAVGFAGFRHAGTFTSDGSSTLASGTVYAADVTSAAGDTAITQIRAGGGLIGGSLTTAGAGDSLLGATLWLDEPTITLTAPDGMATAATLYIASAPTEGTSNNFALFVDSGNARFDSNLDMRANSNFSNPANTFTFGSGVAQTYAQVAQIGAFTSSGLSNQGAKFYLAGSLTGANGDTESLAGLKLESTITTQGTTNTITDVAQIVAHEPVITVGAGDTITNASTIAIIDAPTEGTNNFSLRIASGLADFSGNLAVSDKIDVRGAASPDPVGSALTSVLTAGSDVSTPSGSSATASSLIPAGAFVIGVTTRVDTTITGPSGFDVGDGNDVDRWGNSIAVAAGTTSEGSDFTNSALEIFPTASDVVITSDGVDFTGGSVAVVVHYILLTAPVD